MHSYKYLANHDDSYCTSFGNIFWYLTSWPTISCMERTFLTLSVLSSKVFDRSATSVSMSASASKKRSMKSRTSFTLPSVSSNVFPMYARFMKFKQFQLKFPEGIYCIFMYFFHSALIYSLGDFWAQFVPGIMSRDFVTQLAQCSKETGKFREHHWKFGHKKTDHTGFAKEYWKLTCSSVE